MLVCLRKCNLHSLRAWTCPRSYGNSSQDKIFWGICKPEKRAATYICCQESKLVRIVPEHANFGYADCVSRLLDKVSLRKEISAVHYAYGDAEDEAE